MLWRSRAAAARWRTKRKTGGGDPNYLDGIRMAPRLAGFEAESDLHSRHAMPKLLRRCELTSVFAISACTHQPYRSPRFQ
jgi:hypothetical protein